MTAIDILPIDGGWMLRSDAVAGALVFRSGASAESAAIRLAQGFAGAGKSASISIYIRDGSLAQRLTVPALGFARRREPARELA
jgi:hypothetical protein